MATRLGQWVVVGALLAALAACGGGGGGGGDNGAPPASQAAPTVIGGAGGQVGEASGATVIVPAGALKTDTTVRVAMDSTGAPPLPAGLVAAGNTYVITPHGGEFAQPVEVRIPAPNVTLQPNQALKLAKAQPGGEWEVLDASTLTGGVLSAQVGSFSFFMPVTVTYQLPIAQQEPLRVTSSLDCGTQPCESALGTITATYAVTSNGGQAPAGCTISQLTIQGGSNNNFSPGATGSTNIPIGGGSVTRTLPPRYRYYFTVGARCTGSGLYLNFGPIAARSVVWQREPVYPALSVMQAPAQLDVVEGLGASLDVILAGGASPGSPSGYAVPTAVNRAVIDWQRSDDNGASWRTIARSYQDEANPNPVGEGFAWQYWSVRHGFVAAGTDQGALLRVYACYTPPDVAAPPCVSGPATRLNVLQLSALPAIVDAPRSVLVRAGQTASLSATAGGAPSPTLQWQTRAANSNGAWANVGSGTGGTTGNYTTAVLSTADNGTQYRVVASNARGSTESAAVTVSVSDLDVAPSITTQPASLGVAAGSDAALAIAARGTEALNYQWRKDGVAITGANGPVLRLPAVGVGQAGAYSVTVSNAAGTVDSNPATLTVSVGAPPAMAPTIVTQPVSVLVNAGNTATFAVGASGSGTLSYQWLRNGQPIGGATAAFYSITSAAVADAATYAVQVANGVGPGVTSFNVVLTVNASTLATPVSLQTQPSPQVQAPGGSATFAVAVTGSGPIGYQWLKGGVPIAGATTAVLTLSNVTGSDAADYSVTVNNALATLTSNAAHLTVLGAPLIGTQPAAASATEGASASFSVAATGDALRYQWTRNNVGIAGATSASYTTPALALADGGAVYGVVVYNGAGIAFSQGAPLTVTPAPPAAKAWGAAALIETDNAGNAENVQVAVNASGQAVAVWQQSDGTTINIYANHYTPAAGWGAPQRVSPVVIETSQAAQVAIDSNGNAIVVWMQSRANEGTSGNNIWASRYTPQAGWGSAALIENGPGDAGDPQIAVDGGGNAIAVFWQHVGGQVSIVANRYVAGSGWGTAAVIETDGTGGTGAPQIAMDAAGNAMAVWGWSAATGFNSYAYNVRANRYTVGAGWGSAGPIDNANLTTANPEPQVALDGAGNAIAVWHRPDGSWDSIWASRYVAGTGWGAPALIETDNTNSARHAQVAFDANGNATAVWIQSDGLRDNVLANRYTAGQGWGTAVLIETNDAGSALEPRLVVDRNGNATAVWSQRNVAGFTFNIWANRFSAATGWGTAVRIDSAAGPARTPQIAVDGLGNVTAVWSQSDGTRTNIWANALR